MCEIVLCSDCSGEAFEWNTDQVSLIKPAGCNVLDKLHKVRLCDNISVLIIDSLEISRRAKYLICLLRLQTQISESINKSQSINVHVTIPICASSEEKNQDLVT